MHVNDDNNNIIIYKMNNEIYDIELTHMSPRHNQPAKITKTLKPHQLACLYKAVKMENEGTVHYRVNRNSYQTILQDYPFLRSNHNLYEGDISISTNVGIIGDIVGYGKTLTALSIVAQNSLDNIYTNRIRTQSYHSNKAYNYFTSVCNCPNLPDNMINSTLIIVPRGPVYVQWEKTLKEHTNLKYLAVDNLVYIRKNLPEYKNNDREIIEYFNQFDVVLIKNTTLDILLTTYGYYKNIAESFINRWKRVMVDESHDIINKIDTFHYSFLWMISGTYLNMCNKTSAYNSIYQNIKEMVKIDNINFLLVKCTREFVRDSFRIPPIIENYYLCKLSRHLEIIKNFISPTILEKINANDISGAIKDLGGKNETEEGMVTLICAEINKDISNKQKEREYYDSLDISTDLKANKLKQIDAEMLTLQNKLKDLTDRISEINNKTCPICLDIVEHPMMLDCTHVFCASCLINWLLKNTNNKKCPECRAEIKSTEQLTAIVTEKNVEVKPKVNEDILGKGTLSKEDTLLEIIKRKPHGKFLVFSRIDNGFIKLIDTFNNNHIRYAELKGNTSHMMNVLNQFKNGSIKVILLNTQYAGSGIDISYATDIIIFHSMKLDKQQAVGRAQRVGRSDSLFVHNLCYEHEISENI